MPSPQLCTIPQRTGVSLSPTCSLNVHLRFSRNPFVAPTTKPIADAARYQTPNTFSSTVYTTSVSSVFDTPTIPNFTNCTTTGALNRPAGPAGGGNLAPPRSGAVGCWDIHRQDER